MWWTLPDKEKQRARDKIEMELAMAKHDNPYEGVIQKMQFDEAVRRMKHSQDEMRRSLIQTVAEINIRMGNVDDDEVAKFYLDETGDYMPKLKKPPL